MGTGDLNVNIAKGSIYSPTGIRSIFVQNGSSLTDNLYFDFNGTSEGILLRNYGKGEFVAEIGPDSSVNGINNGISLRNFNGLGDLSVNFFGNIVAKNKG